MQAPVVNTGLTAALRDWSGRTPMVG